MSGSRSIPPTSDRTSLDALSRTIEGLEARIEGLMGSSASMRDPRQPPLPDRAAIPERTPRAERNPIDGRDYQRPEPDTRPDPLAEIRNRQRVLEASRERDHARREEAAFQERLPLAARSTPLPAQRAAAPAHDAMTEIAQALIGLRQDLKQDIAEGVAREMGALRAEIRNIKTNAEDHNFAEDVRADMARLADSINQLGVHAGQPETTGLKAEFEELRSLMDGLAREASVRGMESRWDGLEERLHAIDTTDLQEELVSLAYRLDDMKRQLGGMGESPMVQALEGKLIAIATAMEQFSDLILPHDRAMIEQFSSLDTRLDEISRAIVATGRTAASAADPMLAQRLEGRLTGLAEQIDLMSSEAQRRQQPTEDLASRIEALTLRIEEMSHAEAASKLEERLDQLSFLMERSQKVAAPQPELTGYLSDISRKIDALDQGSVNDVLSERLEYLARRIDEIDFHPAAPAPLPAIDDGAMQRIEGRLSDIVARLEESTAAPPTDTQAMRNLEEQISHLSLLMSEPRDSVDSFPAEFDRRMNAIEDYMTTNDEYIIEAARQAAEAVVQAYSRNGAMSGSAPEGELSALTALAEDLRHLEDLSRSSDERTHRTFEALHDTLVQIANRLDRMETRAPAPRMPAAEYRPEPFEYADTQALAARASAAAPASSRAAPIIRTSPPADAPSAREPEITGEPLDEAAKAEIKATVSQEVGKASLFAGLGKRFRPARKAEAATPVGRSVIDPAPSIDPVDVMPHEEDNQPLEPGSGAPDIKKILERVRASQTAARNGSGKPQSENERADYIAAARRAAQAAAVEVDQTQRTSPVAADTSKRGGSAFSRYRRPILLAVGAALLAIMAFPLVHTLTHGQKAPPPPADVSMNSPAIEEQAANTVATEQKAAPVDVAAVEAPAVVTQAEPPTAPAAAPATDGDQLSAAAPPSDAGDKPVSNAAPAPTTDAPAAVQSDASAGAPAASASAPADPAPAQTAGISVPDTIQPPSLADAARKGDPLALFQIGAMFTDGRGVPTDLKQAASWYQMSADKGLAPAQYRLASMYEKGNGVDRDLAKAKQYYQQASDQGNASAMHNLAVLFASGAVGPQDYPTAANWFIKAANFGVSDSQFNLAILYARGNGVKQDLGESYKWFAIAAKGGDKDAAQKRDEVANAMKPDQLAAARAQVDLWKPQPLDPKANGVNIPDEWGGKGVHTASIDMKKAIRNIQAILNNNGFDAGAPDGEMGAKTVTALKSFQKSVGLEPDGKVTDAVVKQLLARNKKA
ncbi:peptidoglycan-binding protein [Rhizobium tubonense]|uniref:Hemagglutinin n=1 Tax=Rhizobium tubonense TaxID=484088 RepID=A0A2W4CG28_9HYPH|nr:peptidoglycan-binding protein [Rhizobium tubonense]PZM12049.1 hemagglutinin [Rhizobium tubonense]